MSFFNGFINNNLSASGEITEESDLIVNSVDCVNGIFDSITLNNNNIETLINSKANANDISNLTTLINGKEPAITSTTDISARSLTVSNNILVQGLNLIAQLNSKALSTDLNDLSDVVDSKQDIIQDAGLTISKIDGLQAALDSKAVNTSVDSSVDSLTTLINTKQPNINSTVDVSLNNLTVAGDITVQGLNVMDEIESKALYADLSNLTGVVNGKQNIITDGSLSIARTSGLQSALNEKATTTVLNTLTNTVNGKQNTITNNSLTIAQTNGLQTALDAKATTAALNSLTTTVNGKQNTITNNSLSIAQTSGLQTALNAKATTTALNTLTTTVNAKQNTITNNSLTIAQTNGLQTALDAKATTAALNTLTTTVNGKQSNITNATELECANLVIGNGVPEGFGWLNVQNGIKVGIINVIDEINALNTAVNATPTNLIVNNTLKVGSNYSLLLSDGYGAFKSGLIVGSTNVMTSLTNLGTSLETLTTNINNAGTSIETLTDMIETANTNITALQTNAAAASVSRAALSANYVSLNNLFTLSQIKYAFCVTSSNNATINVTQDTILPFNAMPDSKYFCIPDAGAYNLASFNYTIPKTGYWKIGFQIFVNSAATVAARMSIFRNGTDLLIRVGSSTGYIEAGSCFYYLTIGDVIDVRGDNGTTWQIYMGPSRSLFFGELVSS